MVAERDTDSVAPTPTPHHSHHQQQQQQLCELRARRAESSSDENRSSGHASMSSSGSPARQRQAQLGGCRDQLRSSGSGLEDIKLAIQQLTMRSQTSSSTYSSLSGVSSAAGGGRSRAALQRHSSLETVNTNASCSAADEFVWLDSQSRLVELQQPPWSQQDVLRCLQQGRARDQLARLHMETLPRLSYLLQRGPGQAGPRVSETQ